MLNRLDFHLAKSIEEARRERDTFPMRSPDWEHRQQLADALTDLLRVLRQRNAGR